MGTNKVSMDGSFSNARSQGGLGGIFQDDQVNPVLHCVKLNNADSSIKTEILAIRKGFLIVVASHWANSTAFIFESLCQCCATVLSTFQSFVAVLERH